MEMDCLLIDDKREEEINICTDIPTLFLCNHLIFDSWRLRISDIMGTIVRARQALTNTQIVP